MPHPNRKLILGAGLLVVGTGVYWWAEKWRPPAQPSPTLAEDTQPPLPQDPADLKPVTNVGLPWQVRVATLDRVLQARCGEAEFAYLYGLLENGMPKGDQPENWYVVANEVMEQVARRDPDDERFSSRLLKFLADARQPLVLRDYAVQHLATWINPGAQNERDAVPPPATGSGTVPPGEPKKPGSLRSPGSTEAVLKGLVAAALNPELADSTVPGTTCMMLVDLSQTPDGPDCRAALAALNPWLRAALADGSKLSTPLRVSAVQAAALAPDEFRPTLREIAYREHGQSVVRLPAIAALARCGDASDLARLQKIGVGAPELSYAAEDAHRTLTARIKVSPP